MAALVQPDHAIVPIDEGRIERRRRELAFDVGTAVEYIRTFAASWAKAKPPTRATMIQSVYEEIVVRREEFVSVRLTPEAYAHGLARALPAEVVVPALPT